MLPPVSAAAWPDMLETGNGAQAAHANGKEGDMTLDESITEVSHCAHSRVNCVSEHALA